MDNPVIRLTTLVCVFLFSFGFVGDPSIWTGSVENFPIDSCIEKIDGFRSPKHANARLLQVRARKVVSNLFYTVVIAELQAEKWTTSVYRVSIDNVVKTGPCRQFSDDLPQLSFQQLWKSVDLLDVKKTDLNYINWRPETHTWFISAEDRYFVLMDRESTNLIKQVKFPRNLANEGREPANMSQ